MFPQLTEVVRSFPSVYQLLPIYPLVETETADLCKRVAEVDGIPNVSKDRAAEALAFHREIERAVNNNKDNPIYQKDFITIPIVGTDQPTYQSAKLNNGRLFVFHSLPVGISEELNYGDGTVPRLSATPIELSQASLDKFVAERHNALHSNDDVQQNLKHMILKTQIEGLNTIRGPELLLQGTTHGGISLDLEDLYGPDEVVELRATTLNTLANVTAPNAVIELVGGRSEKIVHSFSKHENSWILSLPNLPAGLYQVVVSSQSLSPVHDFFEVVR